MMNHYNYMALGRGLNALISTSNKKTELPATTDKSKVWQIPVSEIVPNQSQPRKTFDDASLKELSDSIKEHGVLQPILVIEKPQGGYELIAGERRFRASKMAGLSTIPALVKTFDEQQKLEVAIIENIQRENLNPLEEAFSYRRLVDEFGLTQQLVADKVGKSRSAVANTIRLLELPEAAKEALAGGKISSGQARALLSLKSEAEQLDALKSILGEKISVRDLEQTVRQKGQPSQLRKDPNLSYLENKLRERLGAKVTITSKDNKGNIIISYHSAEELRGLIEKIVD